MVVDAHHPAYQQVMRYYRKAQPVKRQIPCMGAEPAFSDGADSQSMDKTVSPLTSASQPVIPQIQPSPLRHGGLSANGRSGQAFKPPTRTTLRAPLSIARDAGDDCQARWGRERHEGFKVGKFLQPPPMLFSADHHPLWLGDMYRGRSAFLICGGPSFGQLNHDLLRQPGILTMGINNSVKTFRPNLWVSVDDPSHFIRSTWLDPTITKFVPICHANKRIFNNDAWRWTPWQVRDCPAVHYYKRNEHFQADQFLHEDTFNWGNHKNHGGGRSVMLVAVRLLFHLGIRRVYLLGADFKMDEKTRYHFEQSRSTSSIRGNMSTYQKLNGWFKELRPRFEREGFHVFNCNPDSHLTAFDHVPYEQAIGQALAEWGNIDVATERTAGLYDQEKPKP